MIDISFSFVDLKKVANFLKAASYWSRVDSDLSASVRSVLTESMPKRHIAANFRKPIKSSCLLARMKLTQTWFVLSETVSAVGLEEGGV